jgi:hypothetical protein
MEMEYYIYARPKDDTKATATRFNDESYKDSEVAKGRADQLSFEHKDKVFSVVKSHQRE